MPNTTPFQTATPESVGIPSSAISAFMRALKAKSLCMHSVLVYRRGRLVFEGYAPPFGRDDLHRMYSSSKSFVGMAICLLQEEGKLRLSDRIGDYFPEYMPEDADPYVRETTIRDTLMMASPYSENNYTEKDPNWVATYFQRKPEMPPGTLFHYNTAATTALCGLVEKLTGKTFLEYLKAKALLEIGFSPESWCVERPEGGAWGGSGVQCSSRDLLAFACLLLQKGRFGGRQLLPEALVREATSRQIDTITRRDNPETSFGYGYQIWRVRNDGFALIGMGSELAVCLPKEEMIVVTTGDTQSTAQANAWVFAAIQEILYPALSPVPLAENPTEHNAMCAFQEMCLPVPEGKTHSPLENRLTGSVYGLRANPMGITDLALCFAGDQGVLRYHNVTGGHELRFALGRHTLTTFPETQYFGKRIGQSAEREYRCSCCAVWTDENTLLLYAYLIDWYFGTLRMELHFKGEEVAVRMDKYAEWFLDDYQGCAGGMLQKRLERAAESDGEEVWSLYGAAARAAEEFCAWQLPEYPCREFLWDDIQNGRLLVLRESGRIIGAVSLLQEDDLDGLPLPWAEGTHGVVVRLAVHPEKQGQGIAKELMRLLHERARREGMRSLRLLAEKRNLPANRLYQSQNYRKIGEAEEYGCAFNAYELVF